MTEQETFEQLRHHKYLYYNGITEGTISDIKFDKLEDKARELYPDNEYFKLVGSQVITGTKYEFKDPMRSMQKVNTFEGIFDFLDNLNYTDAISIEPKYDGLSCRNIYIKSSDTKYKLLIQTTRGNGIVGRVINLRIKSIPESFDIGVNMGKYVKVDGEVFIPKDRAPLLPKTNDIQSLRNIAAGILNRKDTKEHNLLEFRAFGIHSNVKHEDSESKYNLLSMLKFKFTKPYIVSDRDKMRKYFQNYILNQRAKWNFETDGLIITINNFKLHKKINSMKVVDHHNHYNIALKPPAEKGITKFIRAEFSVSAFGRITPIAIVEPIVIGSVVYNRSTMDNMQFYVDSRIGPGSEIVIERRNDVIPKIVEVVTETKRKFKGLNKCPECGEPVDWSGPHEYCVNNECPGIRKGRLLNFVKRLGIEDIGEPTIDALYEHCGIVMIDHLIKLKNIRNLLDVDGFGSKKVETIISNITSMRHDGFTFEEILSACSISNVQLKSLKKLKITSLKKLNAWRADYVKRENIKTLFIENQLYNFIMDPDKYQEFLRVRKLIDTIESRDYSVKVCVTGSIGNYSRTSLQTMLNKNGVDLSSSVTTDCKYLLVGADSDGLYTKGSKVIKADKYGIEKVIMKDNDDLDKFIERIE